MTGRLGKLQGHGYSISSCQQDGRCPGIAENCPWSSRSKATEEREENGPRAQCIVRHSTQQRAQS
jgi:hypothetical protein